MALSQATPTTAAHAAGPDEEEEAEEETEGAAADQLLDDYLCAKMHLVGREGRLQSDRSEWTQRKEDDQRNKAIPCPS